VLRVELCGATVLGETTVLGEASVIVGATVLEAKVLMGATVLKATVSWKARSVNSLGNDAMKISVVQSLEPRCSEPRYSLPYILEFQGKCQFTDTVDIENIID
jgi:hypothetical protein